jgi:hypothetical protein
MMRCRWLSHFPNYGRAREIEQVAPGISEADFMARFILRHRPCVVRGGARHWPAVGKWNVELLRQAVGDVPVGRNFGFRLEPTPQYSLEDLLRTILQPLDGAMTYADFFDQVVSGDYPFVQLSSEPLRALRGLLNDVEGFAFFDLARHPARFYPDRLFLARAGYTDWHAHTGDETLTVQICGAKEFLLLPPDQATFRAMRPLSRRGVWRVPSIYWPAAFAALVPWRVALEPGDVVYIPMHWWHAAESADDALNVSLARVFRTPLRWLADLRLPNARFSVTANLLLGALHSARTLDVAPVRQALRLAWLTLGGFPLSLALNRSAEWAASAAAPGAAAPNAAAQ